MSRLGTRRAGVNRSPRADNLPPVQHPFASLKYRIFGHPRFLLRGRRGAQTETSLAAMVHNLKRLLRGLGGAGLQVALAA